VTESAGGETYLQESKNKRRATNNNDSPKSPPPALVSTIIPQRFEIVVSDKTLQLHQPLAQERKVRCGTVGVGRIFGGYLVEDFDCGRREPKLAAEDREHGIRYCGEAYMFGSPFSKLFGEVLG